MLLNIQEDIDRKDRKNPYFCGPVCFTETIVLWWGPLSLKLLNTVVFFIYQ